MLFTVPGPVRALGRLEGWTPDDLAEIIPGTFESAFSPLRVSAQGFPRAPLV
jgi:hypothetical protein